MAKENVEALLEKGAEDREFRIPYDNCMNMQSFVELAKKDGYDFTVDELKEVLRSNGDSFDSYGNPPKKGIWV